MAAGGSVPADPILAGALFDEGVLPPPPAGEFGPLPDEPAGVPTGAPVFEGEVDPGAAVVTDRTGKPPAEGCDVPEEPAPGPVPERLEGDSVGGEAGMVLLSA